MIRLGEMRKPGYHMPRSRRQSSGGLARIMGIALIALFGVILLLAADGSSPDVHHDRTPLVLLAVSFISLLVVMLIASISQRMQLGLQMLTIYFAVFLVLPGFHHTSINTFPFYGYHYDQENLLRASAMVSAFILAVMISYTLAWRSASSATLASVLVAPSPQRVRANYPLAIALTLLSVAACALYLRLAGFHAAFAVYSTDLGDGRAASSGGSEAVLQAGFRDLLRVICIGSLVYAYILRRFSAKSQTTVLLLALNVLLSLTTNWPLALSRFQFFGEVLLIFVLTFDFKKVKPRLLLPGLFVGGALVAMPVFAYYTRERGSGIFNFSDIFGDYFARADFDGLQSVNNAIVYVNHDGLRSGRQLLSAILFFVPRSIWGWKGEPTGSLTARAAGFKFVNISQPLPSEFFVDFGWAGVLVGGLLVGWGLSRLDDWIDRRWYFDLKARIVAGLVVGFSIIVYRGTLLGVVGMISTLAVITLLIAKFGLKSAPSLRSRVAAAPVDAPRPAARAVVEGR